MTFKQIPAQDARGTLKESMLDDPNYIGEEKFDGDRRLSQFTEDGQVRFTGRRIGVDGLFVEKTKNVPHLNRNPYYPLYGTVLDGEMVLPKSHSYPVKPGEPTSKMVTSVMGCSIDGEAERKQKQFGYLEYKPFDCLFYAGTDIRERPLRERKVYAELATRIWGNPYAQRVAYETDKRKLIERMRLEKKEGVILKYHDAKYGEKKHWIKIKFSWTADVVIMGFDPPEEWSTKSDGTRSRTKYFERGWIGAIRCGQYVNGILTECASVSGITDELRESMSTAESNSADNYTGRVIRIGHFGREPTGRFRHPQFGGFRDDKDPKDCVQDLNET